MPPPPAAEGEKNYNRIYREILNVLDTPPERTFEKDNPKRPFVFTREQDMEMIESILDQLSDKQWRETFDVFHLELFFNRLKNKVETNLGRDPIRITVSNVFIEQDRYDATPGISCDFHEKEDATRHCSLSYVRRWYFLFADHICEKIGVKLEPGRHLPSNVALDPPVPFEDDTYHDVNSRNNGATASGRNGAKKEEYDDGSSMVSSACTGYSKFENDDDSESDSDC